MHAVKGHPPQKLTSPDGSYILTSLVVDGIRRRGFMWLGNRSEYEEPRIDPDIAARAFLAGLDADRERKISRWLTNDPSGKKHQAKRSCG